MEYFDFDYTPNEITSDMFLSEVPVSLMKENIIAQFEDPLEFRKKDHITTFISMYRYSKENVDAYEDEELDSIIELRDDFYAFMRRMFKNYLGIGFVDFDDLSEEEQDNLIHFTYRFFLMNIKKNFTCFIINYINDHKSMFENDGDKMKDVTTLSFKKEVTDPEDISILGNLSSIIDEILSQDIDLDLFFDTCDNESTLETRFVSKAYDDAKITGNFIQPYIDMIDSDFKSGIESKIRNKILKKYKKK